MANFSPLLKPLLLLLPTTLLSITSTLPLKPTTTTTWPAIDSLFVDPDSVSAVSSDFGALVSAPPVAVLRPTSASDISTLIHASYISPRPFGVSAWGHGHSIHGQALAPGGVVVEMAALAQAGERIRVFERESYVDAGGEQLWIDVLSETLRHGLAPRSWTDYLYLTVGGTLSNAGISGQAFRHGPQISNVRELDVITGKGEMVTCSKSNNSDLFFAVLGGLGQFGIITRARIDLDTAPKRTRWVRLIYADFTTLMKDQEKLILMDREEKGFGLDYVEGSLMMDQSLSSSWRSSFFSGSDLERIVQLAARFGAVYSLEGSVYYDDSVPAAPTWVDEGLQSLLGELNFVPGFAFTNDVSYTGFLNRVHSGELKLRSAGLWDVPHPWLNLFVPKSRMPDFDRGVFKEILKHNNWTGPVLVYPMNKNKWDERMSAVIPEEEIFYTIGLLRSATVRNWESLEEQNAEILRFCDRSGIQLKQYLPHFRKLEDWKKHFGPKWDKFESMKEKYDPKMLLSPGQRIFTSSLAQLVTE